MQNFVYQLHQHALESGTWNVDVLLPGRQSKYKMTCDKYCMMMINPDAMICYVKSSCFGWSHLSKRWFCWHEENFVNRFFQRWHHPAMNFYGGEIFEVTQIDCSLCLGVSKNRGTPKWMVKIMENPMKMDDLGVPLFSETPIHLQFTPYINEILMSSAGRCWSWRAHGDKGISIF